MEEEDADRKEAEQEVEEEEEGRKEGRKEGKRCSACNQINEIEVLRGGVLARNL